MIVSQIHTIDRRFRFDRFLLLVDSRDDESNLIPRRLCNSREGQGVTRVTERFSVCSV